MCAFVLAEPCRGESPPWPLGYVFLQSCFNGACADTSLRFDESRDAACQFKGPSKLFPQSQQLFRREEASPWTQNGTVVLLQEATKALMVYGRQQLDTGTGKTYDYVACL